MCHTILCDRRIIVWSDVCSVAASFTQEHPSSAAHLRFRGGEQITAALYALCSLCVCVFLCPCACA